MYVNRVRSRRGRNNVEENLNIKWRLKRLLRDVKAPPPYKAPAICMPSKHEDKKHHKL